MNKLNFVIAVFCISAIAMAQVGIGTNTPGSTLEVNGSLGVNYLQVTSGTYTLTDTDYYVRYEGSTNATFTLPDGTSGACNCKGRTYEIINKSTKKIILNPVAGQLIDNTSSTTIEAGYTLKVVNRNLATGNSYWTSVLYASSSNSLENTGFNTSILGYVPVPFSEKQTVTTAPNGATVTELGCKQNPANGHYYCAYQLSSGTNFADTFELSKQIGGYIVTIPNDDERIWVNTNIVNSGTGYNLINHIWIGYAKIATPGNNSEFKWITGEEFKVNWGASPNAATVDHWFFSGEPNDFMNTEGYSHILSLASDVTRKWNDTTGSNTVFNEPWDQVIVEFNE